MLCYVAAFEIYTIYMFDKIFDYIHTRSFYHGSLTRYVKLRVAHAPGMPGTFSRHRVSDPDMHHGKCATHVPWCMRGSLTSGFLWSPWQGKRSRIFLAHAQPAILRIWKETHTGIIFRFWHMHTIHYKVSAQICILATQPFWQFGELRKIKNIEVQIIMQRIIGD